MTLIILVISEVSGTIVVVVSACLFFLVKERKAKREHEKRMIEIRRKAEVQFADILRRLKS